MLSHNGHVMLCSTVNDKVSAFWVLWVSLCRCLQVSEALAIISTTDFPAKWPSLLPDLVQRMGTNDFAAIHGVLVTANSIFKRCTPRFLFMLHQALLMTSDILHETARKHLRRQLYNCFCVVTTFCLLVMHNAQNLLRCLSSYGSGACSCAHIL